MMAIDFSKKILPESLFPKNTSEENAIFFLKEWYGKREVVEVQTSGSTGNPKIFEIEKSRMLASAKMTCDFLHLTKGDTALLCLPVEYISGKMMLVRAIERKLKLEIHTPSLFPLKELSQAVNFCAMTPLQVENSLDKIHLIKKLIIGGAAVSEQLKNKIHQKVEGLDCCIYETYGMSETLSHIALKEIYPKRENEFKTLGGIKISTNENDCLVIEAPELHPQKLETHDLVEIINPTQFRFVGRKDWIINSGGVKIFPEVLETIVKREIPNDIVFMGLPDETYGQKLVVLLEGDEDETLRNRLLNFKFEKSFYRPKAVFFLKEFPRTPNGKIDRRKIQEFLNPKNQ